MAKNYWAVRDRLDADWEVCPDKYSHRPTGFLLAKVLCPRKPEVPEALKLLNDKVQERRALIRSAQRPTLDVMYEDLRRLDQDLAAVKKEFLVHMEVSPKWAFSVHAKTLLKMEELARLVKQVCASVGDFGLSSALSKATRKIAGELASGFFRLSSCDLLSNGVEEVTNLARAYFLANYLVKWEVWEECTQAAQDECEELGIDLEDWTTDGFLKVAVVGG